MDLRESYAHQKRLWLWGIIISILTSSLLLRRPMIVTSLLGIIALGAGILCAWYFFQCGRAIRMMDRGLALYRREDKG